MRPELQQEYKKHQNQGGIRNHYFFGRGNRKTSEAGSPQDSLGGCGSGRDDQLFSSTRWRQGLVEQAEQSRTRGSGSQLCRSRSHRGSRRRISVGVPPSERATRRPACRLRRAVDCGLDSLRSAGRPGLGRENHMCRPAGAQLADARALLYSVPDIS